MQQVHRHDRFPLALQIKPLAQKIMGMVESIDALIDEIPAAKKTET